jgi:hypothetical protein
VAVDAETALCYTAPFPNHKNGSWNVRFASMLHTSHREMSLDHLLALSDRRDLFAIKIMLVKYRGAYQKSLTGCTFISSPS